jgi:hypothetical protein
MRISFVRLRQHPVLVVKFRRFRTDRCVRGASSMPSVRGRSVARSLERGGGGSQMSVARKIHSHGLRACMKGATSDRGEERDVKYVGIQASGD